MNKILCANSFQATSDGHGGNRRTYQIQELTNLAGLEIISLQKEFVKTTKYERVINSLKFLLKYKVEFYPSRNFINVCGHTYENFQKVLSQHKSKKILLWESTANPLFLLVAAEYGFKTIALPQNLESLVVGQTDLFTRQSLPQSLENELGYLGKANAIFCISREEQWFLKLRGIDADFLPYYPPKAILFNLLEVRKQRNILSNNRFLILGTAHNPPTRIGIIEQIQWLSEISKSLDFPIDIAGYGTENLKEYCNSSNFTLHGSVSVEKLNSLLVNSKAVLVHQKTGSGALTRIPEMIIAGIPIIGNSQACRSAFHYSGVYTYDNQVELAELMSNSFDLPPILERPRSAERRFVQYIRQLAANSENS